MTGWILLGGVSAGALLLAWYIYPTVMIAAGERHPLPVPKPVDPDALVSALVATRGEPGAVEARLENLLQSDWPLHRMELIVAVDGDDPARYRFERLSHQPRRIVVVVADPPGGKAAALNAGVRAALGSILVFTDTEQRFAPDAITALVTALGRPGFGAVSGALQIGNEQGAGSILARYWTMERRLRAAEARLHSAIGVSGSIYAMRAGLWTPLPAGLILDDLWIPMRLALGGHRVGFDDGAVAVDRRTTTHRQEFSRKVRTLTGNLQLIAWMPALLLPWRNPVWVQFLCHKLLRLATPYAFLGLAVSALALGFAAVPRIAGALLLGAIILLAAAALWPRGAGSRLRQALVWGLAMQGAVVVATWNGLRGRWDVWKR